MVFPIIYRYGFPDHPSLWFSRSSVHHVIRDVDSEFIAQAAIWIQAVPRVVWPLLQTHPWQQLWHAFNSRLTNTDTNLLRSWL